MLNIGIIGAGGVGSTANDAPRILLGVEAVRFEGHGGVPGVIDDISS